MPPRPATAVAILAVALVLAWPVLAAAPVQTFGPGKVSCQPLVGTRMDCLLAASRITQDNRNAASFSLDALPPGEPGLFRQWCLAASDQCIVTITGWRASPQSTRLSAVTSVHWTRSRPPVNNSAARASAAASSTGRARPDIGPAS